MCLLVKYLHLICLCKHSNYALRNILVTDKSILVTTSLFEEKQIFVTVLWLSWNEEVPPIAHTARMVPVSKSSQAWKLYDFKECTSWEMYKRNVHRS